jgi:predicted MFS family arabinose efflux permease
VFTMFWTGLTFLLSAPPFSYSATQIGLVGFAGLAGTLGARRAGRLHDQGWSMQATGAGLLVALVALVIAAVGSTSIILILIGVVLLDGAVQMVNVLNQTRLFSVDARARSRLNTAFVAGIYTGGAMGSALSGALWQLGGWRALMLCGMAAIGLGLIVWLTQRKVLAVR